MKIKPLLRGIAIAVPVLALGIQLVPVTKTNPPVTQAIVWDSEQTQKLAKRACMDCHSNETVWPWYSNVAPVSWLVANHVREGRHHLNFSEWTYTDKQKQDIAEEVEREISRNSMPDPSYLPMHPEASLSEAEKQQLIDGMKASILK
jgi:cytochrome c551/c552